MTALGPCLYLPRRRIDVEEDIYLTKHKIDTNILLHVCCRYLLGLNFNLHLKEEEKNIYFCGDFGPTPDILVCFSFSPVDQFLSPLASGVCDLDTTCWSELRQMDRNTLTV